ncbi:MAG: sialate O-acetylesterase [Verrucomicrobiales bacterium]
MQATNTLATLSAVLAAALGSIGGHASGEPVRGEDFVRAPAIGGGLCVSNAFQSNMVIQRDKPVPIWGWASPGETVTITFAGATAEAKAEDGRAWRAELPALPANGQPQALTIQGASEKLVLDNILIGDIWVLGGQSNMEFDLAKVDDGALEIASANFPQIRLLTVPKGKGFDSVASFERLEEWSDWSGRHFTKGDWLVCSPETVPEFSAIGYVFGRRLAMATGAPIGLIDASVGGTTVETWTPEGALKKIEGEETRALLGEWAEKIAAFDPEEDLANRIAGYERNKENREKRGDPLPADSQPPSDLRPGPAADRNRPGYCYASMIRPLEGFSVRGAIFHQGFNNCFSGSAGAKMYRQVFPEMITAWRAAFRDESMPFLIISLCTAGDPQTPENFAAPMYDAGPFVREAQHQTYRAFRDGGDQNIGFASSYDLRKSWYHPQIKVPAGERAAKWALATQYRAFPGRDAEHYWLPPSIVSAGAADGALHLKMSGEIKTADDSDGTLLGFAVAGADGRFFPARAEYASDGVDNRNRPKLRKDALVLRSPMVPEPIDYRYAWARNPMGNVVNRYGVPLPTQRSDSRPLEQSFPGIEPPDGMDAQQAKRWLGNESRKALKDLDKQRRIAEAKALLAE